MIKAAFFVSLFLAGCSKPTTTTAVQPTYSSLNKNIFDPRCMECHSTATSGESGADLSDYTKVRAYLSTCQEGDSLYQAIVKDEMPKDRPKLSATEKAAVREWIARGCKND